MLFKSKTSKTSCKKSKKGLTKRGRKYKQSQCSVCKSYQSYTNSMAQCYECQGTMCYRHITCLNYNPKRMKDTDEVRDLCFPCRKKYNYTTI